MKNNKRKLLLTYLLLSSISLSACKSQNKEIINDVTVTTTTEINTTEMATEYTTENIENISTDTTESTSVDEQILNIINSDKEVIEY